jgi:outer membrane protein assembly factor BamB
MNRRDFLAALPATAVASQLRAEEPKPAPVKIGPNDWPWWRGPTRDGVAAAQKIPLEWTADKNVLWEAPVPGRGHGAAIVVGDRVFLATADEKAEVQGVLCLDRKTGKELWHKAVHRGNFVKAGINGKATHASSTPACDGERVYINFPNNGAIYATALDLDGKQVWQIKVTDYTLHQGFGSSPDSTAPPGSPSGAASARRRRTMPPRSSCPSAGRINSFRSAATSSPVSTLLQVRRTGRSRARRRSASLRP